MEAVDDKIFNPLGLYTVHIHDEMVEQFLEQVDSEEFPEEYIFDLAEGRFKINKVKREFRILERYKCGDFKGSPYSHDFEIELQVLIAYKVAKLSGFKVFVEPKYSN